MMRWWWQRWSFIGIVLWPISLVYRFVITIRRWVYQQGWLASYRAPVPVIVVGNIVVGGTGKTPFTIALTQHLLQRGLKVGIVSRGYHSQAPYYPLSVTRDTPASYSGDEALLLKLACDCPIYIDSDRPRAIRTMLAQQTIDVIISDDGLQHLAMQRDIEIIMVDGVRQFGNHQCLPAGPLREPVKKLREADFIVATGKPIPKLSSWYMDLIPTTLVNCQDVKLECAIAALTPKTVYAVAAIGNPQRFFETLIALGFNIKPYAYPDHYAFKAQDFKKFTEFPIIMTSKDAVKIRDFAKVDWWYLAIEAQCSEALWNNIFQKLEFKIDKFKNGSPA